jgi:hypothetical protein
MTIQSRLRNQVKFAVPENLEPDITLRRFVQTQIGKHDVDDTRLENQRVAMEDVRQAPLD